MAPLQRSLRRKDFVQFGQLRIINDGNQWSTEDQLKCERNLPTLFYGLMGNRKRKRLFFQSPYVHRL